MAYCTEARQQELPRVGRRRHVKEMEDVEMKDAVKRRRVE
jgi:hypothetical protein